MTFSGNYPTQYESRLTLTGGKVVFLRPVIPADADLIVDLFQRLSVRSICMRFLRHLHSLPQEMLYQFTHLDYNNEFALAAIVKEAGKDAIIAIARYACAPGANLPELAIAIRDDWQHLGLGKQLLQKIVDIGKEHDIYHFGGMIDPQNKSIMRILSELGYRVEYTLRGGFYEVEIFV